MARKPLTQEQVERARQRARDHYATNKEKSLANVAAWQAANHEKVAAYKKKHVVEHREACNLSASRYRHANPEKRCAWEHSRRAQKRASEGTLSTGIHGRLMAQQRGKCPCCHADLRSTGTHMDHIMPLALGGPNTDDNIQLLCPPCNLSKSAKHPVAFMQQRGYLL